MTPTAADIIATLGLQPHPEGGHFRETFRDAAVDAGGRAASTAIYFLLARAFSASLPASMPRQNFMLAAVYSWPQNTR